MEITRDGVRNALGGIRGVALSSLEIGFAGLGCFARRRGLLRGLVDKVGSSVLSAREVAHSRAVGINTGRWSVLRSLVGVIGGGILSTLQEALALILSAIGCRAGLVTQLLRGGLGITCLGKHRVKIASCAT